MSSSRGCAGVSGGTHARRRRGGRAHARRRAAAASGGTSADPRSRRTPSDYRCARPAHRVGLSSPVQHDIATYREVDAEPRLRDFELGRRVPVRLCGSACLGESVGRAQAVGGSTHEEAERHAEVQDRLCARVSCARNEEGVVVRTWRGSFLSPAMSTACEARVSEREIDLWVGEQTWL
jgi:hypothetical protein